MEQCLAKKTVKDRIFDRQLFHDCSMQLARGGCGGDEQGDERKNGWQEDCGHLFGLALSSLGRGRAVRAMLSWAGSCMFICSVL
jgi:hypothetical protein